METSIIVFTGIVVCGICSLPLVFRSFHKLVKEFLNYQDKQEEKKNKQENTNIKEELKAVTENGSLSDLITSTKKLGENRKK